VRPTADRVKEAWMSMVGGDVVGARVLDLFAGSGSLGLECLSRGATGVVFVERAGSALKALRANIEAVGPEPETARVVRDDALDYVAGIEEPFDVALADPPYGRGLAARLLKAFHEKPFARELWVEHGTGEELPPMPGLESRRYGDTTLTRIQSTTLTGTPSP